MPTTLDPPADLLAAATALDPERFERNKDGANSDVSDFHS